MLLKCGVIWNIPWTKENAKLRYPTIRENDIYFDKYITETETIVFR